MTKEWSAAYIVSIVVNLRQAGKRWRILKTFRLFSK